MVLRTERESIVRVWLESTDEPPSPRSPVLVARVLDALSAWLDSDASEPTLPPLVDPSRPGSVATVLREHQRLREVILERLEAHEAAAPDGSRQGRLDERRRLRRGLDLVARQAVDGQLEQGRQEQQQRADEARQDAEQRQRQAEAASVAKEEFFATISHELRTPLTSMLGWVKLLREESPSAIDPALLAKGLATIERNARSQVQLIEDMLERARAAGRGTTSAADLSIRAIAAPGEERTSDPGRPSLVLAGTHLLVVDDEDDARELVIALLTNAGAHVDAARSVDEALAFFDATSPDAVVSDIGMPGKDGYELVRAVRARTAGQAHKLPVIALTAFARSQDRRRALNAGFSTYLPKPVEPTELIMVLAAALGRDVSLV